MKTIMFSPARPGSIDFTHATHRPLSPPSPNYHPHRLHSLIPVWSLDLFILLSLVSHKRGGARTVARPSDAVRGSLFVITSNTQPATTPPRGANTANRAAPA